jgi:hypothetical protein
MGTYPVRSGLALDVGPHRLTLVPHDEAVQAEKKKRLAECFRSRKKRAAETEKLKNGQSETANGRE